MVRNLTPFLFALALCAPAHADAFDPDKLPPDPARPGWRPPAARAYVPIGGSHFDYDPAAGARTLEELQDDLWLNSLGTWGEGTAQVPLPQVVVPPGCRPAPAAVPGPAGLLGVGAMFHASRQLRRKISR
jgi:hypothetical protein